MKKPEILLENIANLGEGPVWDYYKNILYFVDIDGCKLNIYDYKTNNNRQTSSALRLGMVALCSDADKLVCAVESRLVVFDIKSNSFIASPMPEFVADGTRFNDGKCDSLGRLYVGSLDFSGEKKAKLYVIDNKNTTEKIKTCEENVSISNGIAFSGDEKYMYYIDTPTGFLWRYEYDKVSGNIGNRTALIDYRDEKGAFDGMTIDSEGALWIASWGGFSITKYDPVNGKKLDVIDVPVPNVTSCEFGGGNMQTLFITTAGGNDTEMKKEYPYAGSLFAVETDVKGVKCNKFEL